MKLYLNSEGNKINSKESNNYLKNGSNLQFFISFKPRGAVDGEIKEKLMGNYKLYCK